MGRIWSLGVERNRWGGEGVEMGAIAFSSSILKNQGLPFL